MIRALVLVARQIALAHDRWLATLVRRRPIAAENAALRETVERQRAQIELLRARLLCLHPRRRTRTRPLAIMQQALKGMDLVDTPLWEDLVKRIDRARG